MSLDRDVHGGNETKQDRTCVVYSSPSDYLPSAAKLSFLRVNSTRLDERQKNLSSCSFSLSVSLCIVFEVGLGGRGGEGGGQ